MGWKNRHQAVVAIFLLTLLGSCGEPLPMEESAFNTRPVLRSFFLSLVRLTEPPLASLASDARGEARTRIFAEQAEFREKLSQISPEIQILASYSRIINGFSIKVPWRFRDRFNDLVASNNALSADQRILNRPDPELVGQNFSFAADKPVWGDVSSVEFMGIPNLRKTYPVYGRGTRVGIIDTGVDYTHKMFHGSGDASDYAKNDPNTVEPGSFPTERVRGYDFVGSAYDAGSKTLELRIPRPDDDPLDEGGHGTHVAGTIAGEGYGTIAYSGSAPETKIYALKVFGSDGSTSDAVVISALEYAADPDRDFDLSDHMDAVNLSLGSSLGTQSAAYEEAITNITRSGTLVVVSAGNSGDTPYIVGSPSIANDALSVAASVDGMEHNWRTPAFRVVASGESGQDWPLTEGAITLPARSSGIEAALIVAVGDANDPLDEQTAAKLNGHVALIWRGGTSFCTKGQHALDAGAVGFIMVNNTDGNPSAMGGSCSLPIPGVMIKKVHGEWLKNLLDAGSSATVDFKTQRSFDRLELIDTIAGFSSRGPRSIDGLIKPEITAPGYQIISADMGSGAGVTRMNGTSMAAPHVTGAALLLHEAFPQLSPRDLKARLMAGALSIQDESKTPYPISRQGAGRIRIDVAAADSITFDPPALSLGQVDQIGAKTLAKAVRIKNSGGQSVNLTLDYAAAVGMTILGPQTLALNPGEERQVVVTIKLAGPKSDSPRRELDGWVSWRDDARGVAGHIPVLALAQAIADISAPRFTIASSSSANSAKALGTLTLKNSGGRAATAMLFNPLGTDERKTHDQTTAPVTQFCDLESAGYRIIDRYTAQGYQTFLEFGIKTYQPLTSWELCEPSIQFDTNGDGAADLELIGDDQEAWVANAESKPAAILTDATKLRAIRWDYDTGKTAELDFKPAVLAVEEYTPFPQSTIMIMRVKLGDVATSNLDVHLKVALQSDSAGSDEDDYLGDQRATWSVIPGTASETPYQFFSPDIELEAYDEQEVGLIRGPLGGENLLIIYVPSNAGTLSQAARDRQSLILTPVYERP